MAIFSMLFLWKMVFITLDMPQLEYFLCPRHYAIILWLEEKKIMPLDGLEPRLYAFKPFKSKVKNLSNFCYNFDFTC